MSVTLEQTQILSTEFDLAEHEYQRALDVMRRYFKALLITLVNTVNHTFVNNCESSILLNAR
jgi:hypothetical protein